MSIYGETIVTDKERLEAICQAYNDFVLSAFNPTGTELEDYREFVDRVEAAIEGHPALNLFEEDDGS